MGLLVGSIKSLLSTFVLLLKEHPKFAQGLQKSLQDSDQLEYISGHMEQLVNRAGSCDVNNVPNMTWQ